MQYIEKHVPNLSFWYLLLTQILNFLMLSLFYFQFNAGFKSFQIVSILFQWQLSVNFYSYRINSA